MRTWRGVVVAVVLSGCSSSHAVEVFHCTCVDGDASGPFGGECDLSHWFTDPDDAGLVCL